MAQQQTSLTVRANAVDNASAPLKEVAKSVRALPDQLGKASVALSAMGSASTQLGGQVGAAAQKLSGLAALVAGGGPIGIGIAAVSAAVAVGALAWDAYNASTAAAESAARSLTGVFDSQRKSIQDASNRVRELEANLRNFGEAASSARLNELERGMVTASAGVQKLDDELAKLEETNRKITESGKLVAVMTKDTIVAKRELTREQEEEIRLNQIAIDGLKQSRVNLQAKLDVEHQESELLRDLIVKEKEAEQSKRRSAAATRSNAEAKREAEQQTRALIAAEEAYARTVGERMAANFGQQAAYYTRVADLQEQGAKYQQEQAEQAEAAEKEAMSRREQMAQQYASVLVSSVGGAFESMADGSKTAGEAFAEMFASLGKMVLQQAATYLIAKGIETAANVAAGNTKVAVDTSTAASGAMSAHANIPFVGIAIGLAAAAAIVAAIFSMKKFATGGVVTGGIPGADSVPALLMPNERVLTPRQNESFEKLISIIERGTAGGSMAEAGGGAAVQGSKIEISMRMETGAPPDEAAMQRHLIKHLRPALISLSRDGLLPLGAR